ncbi:hypothetical protein Gpo141_00013037 [Globisporangium polare]
MTGALLNVIQALASLSSTFMTLSPSPAIYRIHKQRSCGEVQVLPLLSLWMSCHIWMMYGYLSGSIFPLFVTFVAGSLLAIGYLAIYFRYTLERTRVRKLIACIFLWNTLILFLSFSGEQFLGITSLSNKDTGEWVGYLADAVSILLYASPFATLTRVIKTKSVATIPIAMVIVGTFSNSLWVLYGFAFSDMIIVVPNVICVLFGCVQTAVYVMYRPKSSPEVDLADRSAAIEGDLEKRDVASLSTIGLDRASCAGDGLTGAHAFEALKSPV